MKKMQKAVRHEYNSINNQMGVLIKKRKIPLCPLSKLAGKKLPIGQFRSFYIYGLEHTVEEISE